MTLEQVNAPAQGYTTQYTPPPIKSIEETGLGGLWLQDLALKVMYFRSYLTGYQIAEALALPFLGIVDQLLETLKREKLVEIKSAQHMGLGEGSYHYSITGLGMQRAREALERSQYAGPAPVPLDVYNEAMLRQPRRRTAIKPPELEQALSELVLAPEILERVGPAVNSGASIFLYGPPGNGKTSIARGLGNLALRELMYIPYSIFIDGQVVTLYDQVNHHIAPEEPVISSSTAALRLAQRRDPRWVRIHRPFVMVGGELNLEGLDLVFDDVNKYYEAPFQVKANGGILLIDDFGRQLVRPRDLLNRWIVPLENRIDYLTLHTGRKLEIPFDVMVVFSTNLPPRDLVDEAFLRRLRHKIEIGDPDFEIYRTIFKQVAEQKGIPYNEQSLAHLLQNWYIKPNRKLRANHPRDLCDQLVDIASYLSIEPEMTPAMLDRAASSYFVDL